VLRILTAIVFAFVTLMSGGCTSSDKSVTSNEWKETGTIELTAIDGNGEQIKANWLGEKSRIAINNNPFVAGKTQKYMWLLWGNKDELVGRPLKVTATSETGEEQTVVESVLGGENWGATASSPSGFRLPTKGLWKLNVFVSDELYGTLIVKVNEA
jgi:hypothetical protein